MTLVTFCFGFFGTVNLRVVLVATVEALENICTIFSMMVSQTQKTDFFQALFFCVSFFPALFASLIFIDWKISLLIFFTCFFILGIRLLCLVLAIFVFIFYYLRNLFCFLNLFFFFEFLGLSLILENSYPFLQKRGFRIKCFVLNLIINRTVIVDCLFFQRIFWFLVQTLGNLSFLVLILCLFPRLL